MFQEPWDIVMVAKHKWVEFGLKYHVGAKSFGLCPVRMLRR